RRHAFLAKSRAVSSLTSSLRCDLEELSQGIAVPARAPGLPVRPLWYLCVRRWFRPDTRVPCLLTLSENQHLFRVHERKTTIVKASDKTAGEVSPRLRSITSPRGDRVPLGTTQVICRSC